MSIPVEIRKAECQLSRIIPCDGAYGQGPFQGLNWREIKSWCPIEWAILGRPYEGRIQCLLMALLGSPQDAPGVDTMEGSRGCILTSAILRLNWDTGIIVTRSLVIARGCFQEGSCDGTSFTPWLVTLLIGGFHGTFCDGTMQCSALTIGYYRYPRIIWDPGIIPGFSWFNLIDCGVALALLEDKQSLARKDYNVPFL